MANQVNFTGEGENFMIIQQGTQQLLRIFSSVQQGVHNRSPYFSFIKLEAVLNAERLNARSLPELMALPTLVAAFEHRAGRLLAVTAAEGAGHPQPLAGPAQWEGIRAAWAFGEMVIVKVSRSHRGPRRPYPLMSVGVETR